MWGQTDHLSSFLRSYVNVRERGKAWCLFDQGGKIMESEFINCLMNFGFTREAYLGLTLWGSNGPRDVHSCYLSILLFPICWSFGNDAREWAFPWRRGVAIDDQMGLDKCYWGHGKQNLVWWSKLEKRVCDYVKWQREHCSRLKSHWYLTHLSELEKMMNRSLFLFS